MKGNRKQMKDTTIIERVSRMENDWFADIKGSKIKVSTRDQGIRRLRRIFLGKVLFVLKALLIYSAFRNEPIFSIILPKCVMLLYVLLSLFSCIKALDENFWCLFYQKNSLVNIGEIMYCLSTKFTKVFNCLCVARSKNVINIAHTNERRSIWWRYLE